MERIEYRTIDKSGWGDGPWHNEPDKVQWQDGATRLPCLAIRHPRLGHFCGYVGVPSDHPLFKKEVDEDGVDVHGGITFGGSLCRPGNESTSICHKPSPGESDHVWWVGFDCAHAWDLSPGLARLGGENDVYRDLAYVTEECRSLAKQIASRA